VRLDLSDNELLNDEITFHSEITDALINSGAEKSKLSEIYITTLSIDVKTHYLELID
jgi:hypothetical protein